MRKMAALNCVVDQNYKVAIEALEMLMAVAVPDEDEDIHVEMLFSNGLIHLDYEKVLS